MIFTANLPGVQTFLRPAQLRPSTAALVRRLLLAFCCHPYGMSASAAAGALRSQARHRAQLTRFLARRRWSHNWAVLGAVADLLLRHEARTTGTWLFLLDQTHCGHQGPHTENTFSRANYRPRPKKSQRRQKKTARKSCHCFVMGLLLTPSGLRIPCCRCYYTQAYCRSRPLPYRKQTELAAELIRTLAVPAPARVVVLGDTAFEAKVIRSACAERSFLWIVPLNPERRVAGPKPRPQVRSLSAGLTAADFQAVRLVPGQGPYAAQQRAARCRVGPQAKVRTFYVHAEKRAVHNVGDVLLVFSTNEVPQVGRKVAVPKILMTNALTLDGAAVTALYACRWQMELFFKELKSVLGFDQYRLRKFAAVEGWVQACLVTFCYLEWTRARQLARSRPDRRWWQWQRSYGLARAVLRQAEAKELTQLYRWSGSARGRRQLRRLLRDALPLEYRGTA